MNSNRKSKSFSTRIFSKVWLRTPHTNKTNSKWTTHRIISSSMIINKYRLSTTCKMGSRLSLIIHSKMTCRWSIRLLRRRIPNPTISTHPMNMTKLRPVRDVLSLGSPHLSKTTRITSNRATNTPTPTIQIWSRRPSSKAKVAQQR